MKTLYKFALVAIAALTLNSCSNTIMVSVEPEANEYWCGKPHSQIIQEYGAPNRETEDGLGGKILIYEEHRQEVSNYVETLPTPGFYGFYYDMMQPARTTVRTTTEDIYNYAQFFIDKKGICYKVVTNLEKEVPKYSKNN